MGRESRLRRLLIPLAAVLILLPSCSDKPAPVISAPASPTAPADYTAPLPSGEENLTPADLAASKDKPSGNPLDFQGRVLYSRGAPQLYRNGSGPLDIKPDAAFRSGDIVVCPQGSELEVNIHTPSINDGVIRVGGGTWLVFEQETLAGQPELLVRLYAGQTSFFMPPLTQCFVQVVTPAGKIQNRGGIFSAAVSPLGQLLVICREGQAVLTDPQETAALPGQVLVVDTLGGGRHYTLKPDDALVFQERWLKVMSEEAALVYAQDWPNQLDQWTQLQQMWSSWTSKTSQVSAGIKNLLFPLEAQTVWISQALALLPSNLPGKPTPENLQELWKSLSKARDQLASIPWSPAQQFPSLIGAEP